MANHDKYESTLMPEKVFVESGVAETQITRQIQSRLNNTEVEYVDDYRNICVNATNADDVYKTSKRCLVLAEKKGERVKEFRCADGLVGRAEHFIVHGNNCCFDCKYCFLQGYFEHAAPTLFVNHDDILKDTREFIQESDDDNLIFHAGELCDSLAFDHLTEFSPKLVKLFSEFPKARLDMRTKTTLINNLPEAPQTNNVIISWTFSPMDIIRDHEIKATTLEQRIEAAEKVQQKGYKVGVCMDPIIRNKGWLNSYKDMINLLFDRLNHEKIAYISLGGFRYLPTLAKSIKERGSGADILLSEFAPCLDGKYRYFRPIRTDLYRKIGNIIRQRNSTVKMFLCMETPEVWGDVAEELNLSGFEQACG